MLIGQVLRDQALQLILKRNDAIVGFDAQGMRCARRRHFIPADAGINIGPRLCRIGFGQRFSAAGAGVNKPVFHQLMERIFVNVEVLALIVNGVIPMQAENLQRFQDMVYRTLGISRRVEIVDAQQPFSLLRAGLKKTGQGRI